MTTLITSRKNLAVELSNGPVQLALVSIKLKRVVELWKSRNEIKIENGLITLN